jgi:hypothetical protein
MTRTARAGSRPSAGGARARRFTRTGLTNACRELRDTILAEQLATPAECAAVWPGGAENSDRTLDGWIYAYAQLSRLFGRLELRSQAGADDARLEQEVRRAAARQPISVGLSVGERLVYPKSAWTLFFLDALDAIVRPIAELQLALGDADPQDLRGQVPLLQGLAWRTWAWILTAPGVDLPFPDDGPIDPPAWTAELLEVDFVRLYAAHRKLHLESSLIMGTAFPSEDGERSRLSLTGFLAGYASEHGIPPSDILRRWSMPEALAAAIASAEAHRVAKANAERERGSAR